MFLDNHRYIDNNIIPGGYITWKESKPEDQKKIDENIEQEMQIQNLREISEKIWKTSRKFDLDTTVKDSKWDLLVNENILQKSLANDSFIYVEGESYSSSDILSKEQFVAESKLEANWDQISGGDDYIQFNHKLDEIDMRKKPKLTMFDTSPFL